MRSTTSPRLPVLTIVLLATLALGGCRRDAGSDHPGSATADTASTDTASTDPTCSGEPGDAVTHRYRSVAGVDADLTSLDVHAPEGAAGCPAVIFVHGGGWRRGDKDMRSIDTKAEYLNGRGIVLISVNYRLAQPDNDVRWPDFGTDVATAVDWTMDHADELGVDPTRVTLMGHSAGAHLVGIVATHPELLSDVGRRRADLACVVELDTAADDLTDGDRLTRRLVEAAFGDDPAVLADASPLVQVRDHPGDVADFLLVTRGRAGRTAETQVFAEALEAVGARATVVDADPLTHRQVNTELGSGDDRIVTPAVSAFLDGCTAPR